MHLDRERLSLFNAQNWVTQTLKAQRTSLLTSGSVPLSHRVKRSVKEGHQELMDCSLD